MWCFQVDSSDLTATGTSNHTVAIAMAQGASTSTAQTTDVVPVGRMGGNLSSTSTTATTRTTETAGSISVSTLAPSFGNGVVSPVTDLFNVKMGFIVFNLVLVGFSLVYDYS
jgi:hypothetical protein